jgi:hypothetical protein
MNILSDELVEKVNLGQAPPPPDWVSRCLFTNGDSVRNFLAAVGQPAYARYNLQPICREAVAQVCARTMISLGPGDGNFDAELVRVLQGNDPDLVYIPVDISRDLLEAAMDRVSQLASVPVGVLADISLGPSVHRVVLGGCPGHGPC